MPDNGASFICVPAIVEGDVSLLASDEWPRIDAALASRYSALRPWWQRPFGQRHWMLTLSGIRRVDDGYLLRLYKEAGRGRDSDIFVLVTPHRRGFKVREALVIS